jgi:hypothetical protein
VSIFRNNQRGGTRKVVSAVIFIDSPRPAV